MSAETLTAGGGLRRGWTIVAAALMSALFAQAVFAGAMMSGAPWARPAHMMTAAGLVLGSAAAGLVGVVTLRRIARGTRFGLTLLGLAALVVFQLVLGRMAAHGGNLMWAHIPLGVALVGLAGQALASARKLGG